jgi:hypothetical protein
MYGTDHSEILLRNSTTIWYTLYRIGTERVCDPLYSKHKYRRLYGKDAVSNTTRTGQVVHNKYSKTPYCIEKDTQPASAAEYRSSSLMRATQGTPIEDSGGT